MTNIEGYYQEELILGLNELPNKTGSINTVATIRKKSYPDKIMNEIVEHCVARNMIIKIDGNYERKRVFKLNEDNVEVRLIIAGKKMLGNSYEKERQTGKGFEELIEIINKMRDKKTSVDDQKELLPDLFRGSIRAMSNYGYSYEQVKEMFDKGVKKHYNHSEKYKKRDAILDDDISSFED